MLRRVPSRSSWQRVRKARPHLLLSRRGRRRFGVLTRGELRRLRRRLLRAHALGGDWKLGVPAGAHVAVKCKLRARSRPAPCSQPAPSGPPAPRTQPGSCSLLNPRNHSTPQSRSGRPVQKVSPNVTQPARDLGSGRVLLMLPPGEGFTFSGICRVTCIYGQLEIYGHIIKQGHPPQDVFSVYTHSYLTINGVPYSEPEKSEKGIRREIRALLKPYTKLDDRDWVIRFFPPLGSILILERMQTRFVDFLKTYKCSSYVLLQEEGTLNIPARVNSEFIALRKIGIRRQKRKKGICLSESGLAALEELVSVSCGIPGVDYLECDLGQTEFTPPGCISLLNITEPLLGGPPYTHQRKPQRMVYYGKMHCHGDYESYIEIVKYVFKGYRRESPLIINTMGWVTDDGVLLLVDLIRVLSPNYVIQLYSDREKFVPTLTSEYVELTDGLYTKSKIRRYRGFEIPEFRNNLEFNDEEKECSPVPVFTGHTLMTVHSEFLSSKNEKNRAKYNRIFRDLAMLGYLSQLMLPEPEPLSPLHSLTPYQVPFSAVAIRVTHADVAPTHILYAVNASWVGLCRIVDDMKGYTQGPILLAQNPICDCLGFGICRGIDMDKRVYHILTPLHPEELKSVNCLLIGSISIPHCIFKNQPGPEGTVPYVTRDYKLSLPGASEKIGEREYGNAVRRQKLRQRRK
ncbi:Polynucleotide 5'-hydroxyl-kinase NOL9 [Apodemus speciosus]|uniref:Polynucleotide 5'-hydroxyl-kinase NOL9 n=1 Tax=Apodemus speciosus TaxID=105296 RepID=A0ABQ0EQF1_APOSI